MSNFINTLFVGKVLHQFDALASTNQFALDLLSKSNPSEGTVVLTRDQYAGKGQINNKWESEAGKNLTFSVLLYPKFLAAKKQFLLSQVVSLAIFDALKEYISRGLKIKWPNDLYVFDKKVTGILIQNSLKGYFLQASVIGIGVNVNQIVFRSHAPNPTSLALEIKREINLNQLLSELFYHLETRYLQLKAGRIEQLRLDYMDNLYRLGKASFFKRPNGIIFKGKIRDISESGKLIIDTKNGKEKFSLKEIEYVV